MDLLKELVERVHSEEFSVREDRPPAPEAIFSTRRERSVDQALMPLQAMMPPKALQLKGGVLGESVGVEEVGRRSSSWREVTNAVQSPRPMALGVDPETGGAANVTKIPKHLRLTFPDENRPTNVDEGDARIEAMTRATTQAAIREQAAKAWLHSACPEGAAAVACKAMGDALRERSLSPLRSGCHSPLRPSPRRVEAAPLPGEPRAVPRPLVPKRDARRAASSPRSPSPLRSMHAHAPSFIPAAVGPASGGPAAALAGLIKASPRTRPTVHGRPNSYAPPHLHTIPVPSKLPGSSFGSFLPLEVTVSPRAVRLRANHDVAPPPQGMNVTMRGRSITGTPSLSDAASLNATSTTSPTAAFLRSSSSASLASCVPPRSGSFATNQPRMCFSPRSPLGATQAPAA